MNPQDEKTFVPVRLNTIRPDEVTMFDVYIAISEKHIHYMRANDKAHGERLAGLKKKGVRKLFIPIEQEPNYLKYLDKALLELKGPDQEGHVALVKDSLTTQAENANRIIESEVLFKSSSNQVEQSIAYLQGDPARSKKLLQESGVANGIAEHAVNVSTLCIGLADKFGISATDKVHLGLAAIFHDLGREEGPVNQNHPKLAAEKLNGKAYITPQVISLVLDHEEIGPGMGYPNKKDIKSLSKHSQLLNLCNHFDRYCTEKKITHKEAVKSYFKDSIGLFELTMMNELAAYLKS